jgi:hypothetical protein
VALSRSTSSRFDINVGLDESLARDSLPVELQWLHPGMCNLDPPTHRLGHPTAYPYGRDKDFDVEA